LVESKNKAGRTVFPLWKLMLSSSLLLILTACQPAERENADLVFRYNEAAGISSLDPAFARNLSNIWAVSQLFNGLVELNDQMVVQPSLAKRWEIDEDGTLYRFFLRQDVRFHHDLSFSGSMGRPIRASDFIYSFGRIADPQTASPGAWVFNEVARRADGKLQIEAPNDSVLEIRLNRPFPPFLGILTMPYCALVMPEAVRELGQDYRRQPIGTGPFRFQYWKEGVKLVLRRNPFYFEEEDGQRLPYLEAVSISFIIDKQAAFLEFLKGKLDFMSGIDPSYKDELLTPEGELNAAYTAQIRLTTQPYLNTEYLGFMLNPASLDKGAFAVTDKKIRQAINYGFDRAKMIRFLRNNMGSPGTGGIIPRGLPGADTLGRIGYGYDPKQARRLLEEAGYPEGQGLPEITLSTTAEYLDVNKFIQHELSRIGIKLKMDVNPPAALKELKARAKLPFFRASWIADYPDAENYLSLFHSANFCPDGPNYAHYASQQFDELYAAAMKEADAARRAEIYYKMDSLVMEDAPVVILYYDEVMRFTGKNIRGLGSNPINQLNLKRVYKVRD